MAELIIMTRGCDILGYPCSVTMEMHTYIFKMLIKHIADYLPLVCLLASRCMYVCIIMYVYKTNCLGKIQFALN